MALHVNLHRDGYEVVAERIAAAARSRGTEIYAIARRDGRVSIEQAPLAGRSAPTVWFQVGPYNRGVMVEWVEDDLIEGMRDARKEAA
jgi:hypothetical protein